MTSCLVQGSFSRHEKPTTVCIVRNDILHVVLVLFEWIQAEEGSESPLNTQLSLSCLFDGLVNQPHFFLAQSSLHVTVHDAVTVAHLLSPVGKQTAESNPVRRIQED